MKRKLLIFISILFTLETWDPAFPNGGSGTVTMSASSTTFYSADGLTQLKWNLGYIRNIN